MTDRRDGDPHPDGLPEEAADAVPDSLPADEDEAARQDVENVADVRSDGIEQASRRGEEVEPDPRVNGS